MPELRSRPLLQKAWALHSLFMHETLCCCTNLPLLLPLLSSALAEISFSNKVTLRFNAACYSFFVLPVDHFSFSKCPGVSSAEEERSCRSNWRALCDLPVHPAKAHWYLGLYSPYYSGQELLLKPSWWALYAHSQSFKVSSLKNKVN